jgi:hypothetical protein
MAGKPERYAYDVMGMPCFPASEKFQINVSRESMKGAVPQDDENCAIALGCKAQLQTPYVSVGRSRTDLALPHPDGVEKPGYGPTKWAVVRFGNTRKMKEIIVAADTGTLGEEGALVTLLPPKPSLRPVEKRRRNKTFRTPKGVKDGRGIPNRDPDELTAMGVRILTGQRRR